MLCNQRPRWVKRLKVKGAYSPSLANLTAPGRNLPFTWLGIRMVLDLNGYYNYNKT